MEPPSGDWGEEGGSKGLRCDPKTRMMPYLLGDKIRPPDSCKGL
jgi:hypothetical protein